MHANGARLPHTTNTHLRANKLTRISLTSQAEREREAAEERRREAERRYINAEWSAARPLAHPPARPPVPDRPAADSLQQNDSPHAPAIPMAPRPTPLLSPPTPPRPHSAADADRRRAEANERQRQRLAAEGVSVTAAAAATATAAAAAAAAEGRGEWADAHASPRMDTRMADDADIGGGLSLEERRAAFEAVDAGPVPMPTATATTLGKGGSAFKLALPASPSAAAMREAAEAEVAAASAAVTREGAVAEVERQMVSGDTQFVSPLEDVLAYADYIGIDIGEDAELLWMRTRRSRRRSSGWEECQDLQGGTYWYNPTTLTVSHAAAPPPAAALRGTASECIQMAPLRR